MTKWYVVVPNLNESFSHEVLDTEDTYPEIKKGLFVKANSEEEALKLVQKRISHLKSCWAVLLFEPKVLVSFTEPAAVYKQIMDNGEVLPL